MAFLTDWEALAAFFSLIFLGGRAIHYTYMDMQRKKPQVSNGKPSTAEAASYPHYLGRGRHKSLPRGNMSGKTSSPQGSCSPAHSQACLFSLSKGQTMFRSTRQRHTKSCPNGTSSRVENIVLCFLHVSLYRYIDT